MIPFYRQKKNTQTIFIQIRFEFNFITSKTDYTRNLHNGKVY